MKTVKVRVAVTVDAIGYWNASGYSLDRASKSILESKQGLRTGIPITTYWLTAELPVPEVRVVAASVEKVQ